MWSYQQSTGLIRNDVGAVVGAGYSGHAGSINVPADQDKPNLGPIPQGRYVISPPVDTETHGPYVLPLSPYPTNEMHGRSGFLIHGDSIAHAGERAASAGCIIALRRVRQAIWESGDHVLWVIA